MDCIIIFMIILFIIAFISFIFKKIIPSCYFSSNGEDHDMIDKEQIYYDDDGVKMTRTLGRCKRCGRWEDDCDW